MSQGDKLDRVMKEAAVLANLRQQVAQQEAVVRGILDGKPTANPTANLTAKPKKKTPAKKKAVAAAPIPHTHTPFPQPQAPQAPAPAKPKPVNNKPRVHPAVQLKKLNPAKVQEVKGAILTVLTSAKEEELTATTIRDRVKRDFYLVNAGLDALQKDGSIARLSRDRGKRSVAMFRVKQR